MHAGHKPDDAQERAEDARRGASKALLRRVLTPEEWEDSPAAIPFSRLWTRKEAVMKACGLGLGLAPASYCVLDDLVQAEGQTWRLHTLELRGHFVSCAAEAAEAPELLHLPPEYDPERSLLEITVRDRVFAPARRGLGYIHIEGFVFEHCANQAPFPQLGMVSTRSGHDWVIRDNVIRHARTVGLDVGSEYWRTDLIPKTTPEDRKQLRKGGRHLVTGNLVVDNGLCGIAGWSCRGVKIIGNTVERNNNLSLTTSECDWEEWAGIKLHEADAALVEGNLVRFNGAHGIWFDNGYDKARITRNVVFGNIGSGIFIELGAGCVMIDNNIVANTTPFTGYYPGRGIYVHDASGVKICHNLVFDNAAEAVFMHNVTDRKTRGKTVETSDELVVNNIFCNNGGGVSLPVPGDRSENCVSDRNLFVGDVGFRYSGSTPWEKISGDAAKLLTAEEMNRVRVTKRVTPEV